MKYLLSSPSFTEHRVIIYTDAYTISKTIAHLHNSMNSTSSNHYVSVEWIPGHKVHYGNELVDRLTKIREVDFNPLQNLNETNHLLHEHFSKTKSAATLSKNTDRSGKNVKEENN